MLLPDRLLYPGLETLSALGPSPADIPTPVNPAGWARVAPQIFARAGSELGSHATPRSIPALPGSVPGPQGLPVSSQCEYIYLLKHLTLCFFVCVVKTSTVLPPSLFFLWLPRCSVEPHNCDPAPADHSFPHTSPPPLCSLEQPPL